MNVAEQNLLFFIFVPSLTKCYDQTICDNFGTHLGLPIKVNLDTVELEELARVILPKSGPLAVTVSLYL